MALKILANVQGRRADRYYRIAPITKNKISRGLIPRHVARDAEDHVRIVRDGPGKRRVRIFEFSFPAAQLSGAVRHEHGLGGAVNHEEGFRLPAGGRRNRRRVRMTHSA